MPRKTLALPEHVIFAIHCKVVSVLAAFRAQVLA